jgi:hypothetical protein
MTQRTDPTQTQRLVRYLFALVRGLGEEPQESLDLERISVYEMTPGKWVARWEIQPFGTRLYRDLVRPYDDAIAHNELCAMWRYGTGGSAEAATDALIAKIGDLVASVTAQAAARVHAAQETLVAWTTAYESLKDDESA